MKRRSFLALLGLSPIGLAAPTQADSERSPTEANATLRAHMREIAVNFDGQWKFVPFKAYEPDRL